VAKKITDYDYSLPVIEAQDEYKTLSGGRNKPLLFRGVCQNTYKKGDYVVKFRNSKEMSNEASARELLASFIALQLELLIPPPVLVNISYGFVQTIKGKDSYIDANNSIGVNFGCKFIPGNIDVIHNQVLTENQRNQANQIFPFDVFISNSDRRNDKPNLLMDDSGNIFIFDHELAFGFVFDIFKNKTPWEFRPQDKDWIKNHFFYSYLKNRFPDFTILVNKLTQLDDGFWDKAFAFIPKEWQTEQLDEIKNYCQALIANKDLFLQELKNVLFK
jgi:hypothetical protein